MASSDLELVSGTSFGFDVVWSERVDGKESERRLDGCRVRFQVVSSGRVRVDCSTENNAVLIDQAKPGWIRVNISPDMTRGQTAGGWLDARYELRVYFPSGDEYSLLRGQARLIDGVIRDSG